MRKNLRILFFYINTLLLIKDCISIENDYGKYEKGRILQDESGISIEEDDEYAQSEQDNHDDENSNDYLNEILVFVSNDVIINKNKIKFNREKKDKQNNHTFIKDYILNYALLTISNNLNDNLICDLNDNRYLDKLCKKSINPNNNKMINDKTNNKRLYSTNNNNNNNNNNNYYVNIIGRRFNSNISLDQIKFINDEIRRIYFDIDKNGMLIRKKNNVSMIKYLKSILIIANSRMNSVFNMILSNLNVTIFNIDYQDLSNDFQPTYNSQSNNWKGNSKKIKKVCKLKIDFKF
jgi:hypothetical protein